MRTPRSSPGWLTLVAVALSGFLVACGGHGFGPGGVGGVGGAAGGSGGTDGGPVDAGDAEGPPSDPFMTATPIVVGGNTGIGSLDKPTSTKVTFSFAGTAGEAIAIETLTSATLAFSPILPDLVATLYDASETQIARNDDPWPRTSTDAVIYTVLPATGTYYVVIADCNAVFGAGAGCGAPDSILNYNFSVRIHDVTGATVIGEGAEPDNDTAAGAATVAYTKAGGTDYVPLLLAGAFQSGTDTDTYGFTVPTDTPIVSGARARASFWILPSGANGDGSTGGPGSIFVVDPADTSGAHLAEIDGTTYGSGKPGTATGPANLSVPIVLGHRYNLVVKHAAQAAGARDFYFIAHAAGAVDVGALEAEPDDALSTNELLLGTYNLGDGSTTYVLDGDLVPAATDLDFIALDINQPTVLTGACQAARRGSGLVGLGYELLNKNDGSMFASQTESGTSDLGISVFVPADGSVVLKIGAGSQSAAVTDTSYVCRFRTTP